MNKGIRKSTFREIKSSFGRYMAILLIVALGVGFFSGLKVAYEAMVHTADCYFKDKNFYDYHLLSTIGFDEDTADSLEQEDGVRAAEGTKSLDILVTTEKGTEEVVKTLSLPEKVNVPELTAGRMPEKENECLADEHHYKESDIGKKLVLSKSNDEEDLDKFAVKEYTIVGLVRSPLYTLYDRGTTSVGDGMLDAFLYIPKNAYDMDYDTDIYVVFDQDTAIYSEEYDDFIEEKEDIWEDICKAAANSRYDRIYTEAMEEIEDADSTLQEKKEDGEQELAEALDTLNDGKNQIADGENAIATAKKTIQDNEKTLEQKEAEYQKGLAAYQKNKKTYDEGKSAYDEGVETYNTQYASYQENLAAYETNKAAYDSSEAQYQEAKVQYDANKVYLSEAEQQTKEQELGVWRATLDETGKALTEAKAQLDTAAVTFAATKATLDANKTELSKADKQLKKAKKQLDEAGTQLDEAKKQIISAKNQISDKEQELSDAKEEIEDGQAEYEDAKEEYDEKISDAQKEIQDARDDLADLEKPDVYVLGRNTNSGYASFENDSAIVMGVAKVFPIFFFLVAALVCMTTMTRMIEEQRTQIGILKALGYSNSAVMGKYITYSGSAAVVGAVLGFFAGTWVFSIVIWTAYKMLYDMGSLHYVFDAGLAGLSMVVALLCSAGTTFVACYQELREMAAMLMRPKAPKVGKRVLLEKIPAVWNRLKFLDKVSVRNLFRYKKRFFMMIIGVSGCTALLVAGMGIRDSIATIADTQFDTISLYDMAVGVKEEEDVFVEGMKDSIRLAGGSVDMQIDDKVKGVSLLAPEDSSRFEDYMNLHTEEGEPVAFPEENEVVISFKLADNYNIKVGDEISLQNSDLKGGTVVVSGIYLNYFNHYVIMTPNTYKNLFGEEAEYNELFVNIEEDADVHDVASRLMKEENVSAVSVSEDMKDQVSDMMGSLDYVVILVIACAAMLAFIVIYNLNNINITERVREIATIKVLGFYKEETNSYVFRENILLTLIGSLLGLVLGHYLHAFIMDQIQIDAIAFDVNVKLLSFCLSVVLTLLFNQIVNFFMSKKLEKIDMAESLKSVE
ncbi:MAG: FtsX-like permease family protein [Lachnospiraceae bacterium]